MKKSRSVAAAHDDDDNGDDRSLPVANDDDDDDDEQPARLTCNLVIIDQDNVRAAMGWLAGRDFRECVRRWVAAHWGDQKSRPLVERHGHLLPGGRHLQ